MTRQMEYSAVPPITIASVRLAMLPPGASEHGCWFISPEGLRKAPAGAAPSREDCPSSGIPMPAQHAGRSQAFGGGRSLECTVNIRLRPRCQEFNACKKITQG